MKIHLDSSRVSPRHLPVEVVERKGLGHPDTLADGLAETLSCVYSAYTLEQFGAVLHHNIDKLSILGGLFESDFGHTRMREPITVTFNGRMSTCFGDARIDVEEMLESTARDYLTRMVPPLDAGRHVVFHHQTSDRSRHPRWFRPRDLRDLPEVTQPTASDSATIAAHWPPSPVERLVLGLERYLNDFDSGPRYAYLGSDVKVMATRVHEEIEVLVAVPVLCTRVSGPADYDDLVSALAAELTTEAARLLPEQQVRLRVNSSAENPYQRKRHYLLGIGSCVECGEEGVVGRGNGVSGVIALGRPNVTEAPFGKNPTYHAGKVYAYYAQEIARSLAAEFDADCTVSMTSHHSSPLGDPHLVHIQVASQDFDHAAATRIVRDHLAAGRHLEALVHDRYLLPV